MRTTVTLNDDLLATAQELTGIEERGQLIHAGLQALVQREASRRLAALGGTMPNASAAPRRRAVQEAIKPSPGRKRAARP